MSETVRFGQLFAAPLRNGVSYTTKQRGSGIPMVNMREIFAYDRISDQECELAPLTAREKESSLLADGDLLFARQSLTYEGAGKCVLVLPSETARTWESHLIRVRLDTSLAFPDYYFYYFKSAQGRRSIETIIHQVAAAGIRGSDLAKLLVPSVPLNEQWAIAEVLGALDDKIAANTEAAATAEELIEAHHQRAKATDGTASRRLFEIVDVDFGEPFKGAEFTPAGEGRPLIRIRDLKTFQSQVWTSEKRGREVVVLPGDVVVGMDAEFRPTTWLGEAGMLNQRVCRVRGKESGNAFVREALKAPLRRVEGSKSATTVIHLNKSDLERIELLVPAPAAMNAFEEAAEPVYGYRVSLASENRTLSATRDVLLPALMSGKLRVRDAEKVLEGVL